MTNYRLLFFTTLVGFAGLISCSELGRVTPNSDSVSVLDENQYDPEALKMRIDSGEDVFLLDVRQPHELEEKGAIEGYVNIPMAQLKARLAEVPRDRPIVVY